MADKRIQAGTAGALGMAGSVTVSTRHYLAAQHLWSALHSARLCSESETQLAAAGPLPGLFPIEHRTCAINSVLAAVAFLEALVNEAFQDAADTPRGTTKEGISPRIKPLGDQSIRLMGEFWKTTKDGERYMSVLDNYQMALLFADKPTFHTGVNPYQDANLLIDIRNALVHFRPAWHKHGDRGKLEKSLTGKFDLNSLMGPSNVWFPDKCLGAGCANWACVTSRSLADDWIGRLGVPCYYEIPHSFPPP